MARDDQEDAARARDRDALSDPDSVSRRFRWCEPAISGRRFPRPIWRGAVVLLQLDHASLSAGAADRGRHGTVHCGRRIFASAIRSHRDGEGNLVHGSGGSQSREGRYGPDDRRRDARRGPDAHGDERRRALCRRRRSVVPNEAPRAGGNAAGTTDARRDVRSRTRYGASLRSAAVGSSHVVRHARSVRRARR